MGVVTHLIITGRIARVTTLSLRMALILLPISSEQSKNSESLIPGTEL